MEEESSAWEALWERFKLEQIKRGATCCLREFSEYLHSFLFFELLGLGGNQHNNKERDEWTYDVALHSLPLLASHLRARLGFQL